MFVFRWLSLVLIVMAVMLLGADLVGTLEKKAVAIRSLSDVLLLFNCDAKAALVANLPIQAAHVGAAIIDGPGWLLLAFFGFVFAILAPDSKPVRPLPPPPPIPR